MRGNQIRQFRRTGLTLAACLAVLCGVGLAHNGQRLSVAWCVLSGGCVFLSMRRRRVDTLLLVIIFGLTMGWWRGSLFMDKLAAYRPYYGKQLSLTAIATGDAVYGKNAALAFDADHVALDNGKTLSGKLEVSGFGVGAVYQGDEMHISGKLFPALGAYQGRISFAKLELVDHHPTLVAALRRNFAAGLQSALPEPLAPFAMGLLVGQRATLPATVKQDLLMVGLTHIIAVSGYNLTIMLNASRRLLGGRSKRMSTMLSLGLMAVFVILAGASASIIRAAIVSLLSIIAGYYGRSVKPLNLIAVAAAITALANPFYVWTDTSWYLSFLAFFGVMVLAPQLSERLPIRVRESVPVMVGIESISAEALTLPFVVHTFGQMSLIGLLANVAVVTLVPLAMLLSLFAGLAGMWAASIAGWVAWPARLLLNYMLDTAHVLAGLPHIFLQQLALSQTQMLGCYLSVLIMTAALANGTKRARCAKITDKNDDSRSIASERS